MFVSAATQRRAPAPTAAAPVVTALIVLLALLAIPYHFAGPDVGLTDAPIVQDWRGNSADLSTLR